MKNIVFLLFCAFSLFLAIYYYRQYDETQRQLELANRRVLDRDTMIYGLQKKVEQRGLADSSSVDAPEVVPSPSTLGKLSPGEINRLKAKGLKNPEADLKTNLTENQQNVLQQKGTLGGTMAIRDIQILNERYALAYFEDGHQGGYMILKYEVQPTGRIAWVVLDSYQI
ncbi:hypothetical protein AAE02nite_34930 [Adhaeribacter aerolatus]|uniref:Uncharacterized protein n=1 Tax=Adhaeribacter aerolatus TaxID=670289 RepID=A0A512B1L7_9BACT|nr:hypothetical protein [Adhaeribacter aerolatus]GEO05829.1 hypothetical protein AAE02nite_34930 [Adhaeribacter aerolatus]